jgi:exonuclease SbcC
MILETIDLTGFLSFVRETVDFRQAHNILVFGPNGEGKSALLESIPFCFWGVGRGRTIADYINNETGNCKFVRVGVVFLMEGIRYKKIRQCGEASNINELYVDKNKGVLEDAQWRLITDDTKKNTDNELSKILGQNYNIFTNSSFFGQKEASSFIDGTAADRKELLSSLLNIELYDAAEEIEKAKVKEIDNKLQTKSVVLNDKLERSQKKEELKQQYLQSQKKLKTTNEQITQLKKQIAESQIMQEKLKIDAANSEKNRDKLTEIEARLKSFTDSKKEIESDLAQTTEDLESLIDEGIEKIEELQVIIDSKEELEKQKAAYEVQLEKIIIEKKKIPKIKDNLKLARNSKELLLQQTTELKSRVKSFDDKLNKIKKSGAVCPVTDEACDKLSAENKKIMLDAIESDKDKIDIELQKTETKLEQTRQKIVEVDGELEVVSKRVEGESKIESKITVTNSDLKRVEDAVAKMPEIKKKYRTKVDTLTATKAEQEKRLVKVKADYNSLKDKKEQLDKDLTKDNSLDLLKIVRQIKVLNEDLSTLEEDKEELMIAIGQSKKELEQAEQAFEDATKMQKEVDDLKKELRVHTELASAFGKNGIPKDIMTANVPVLEENANLLLSKFTKSNDFNIKFDLDPRTQSGKLKKTGGLDIIISKKNGVSRSLNMYSGGETVRIVFAILLSLSDLLTKRAGKRNQTLIIDERVAALDTEGINQFVEIVKYVSEKYKKILVVSHIPELNEAFSNIILVNKNETEGSKVSYQFSA